eukprot:3377048-Pleurochrysis_carterae.AAC.2
MQRGQLRGSSRDYHFNGSENARVATRQTEMPPLDLRRVQNQPSGLALQSIASKKSQGASNASVPRSPRLRPLRRCPSGCRACSGRERSGATRADPAPLSLDPLHSDPQRQPRRAARRAEIARRARTHGTTRGSRYGTATTGLGSVNKGRGD